MILYFSGTGNSEYVAKRIGRDIGDKAVDLFGRIRTGDFSEMESEGPWVVVVPIYAWRIPRVVEEWLKQTKLTGSREIYFVLTCGGSMGNADKYIRRLCDAKQMTYMGCREIVMPENYVAMFSTPTREQALEIIRQAESVIDETALRIKRSEVFPLPEISFGDKVSSGFINGVFYLMAVRAKPFYAERTCISCGKCADVCPLGNIHLVDGKPVWGKACTQCMACISRCPKEAIEYGRRTKGKARYVFPGME